MKKILFLILLVSCTVGFVSASTPTKQNDFRVLDNNLGVSTQNPLLQVNNSPSFGLATMAKFTIIEQSQRSACSNPPEDPDAAEMIPSCADVGDNPPDDPHGNSQKSVLPYAQAGDLVAKYYILNPSTQVYEYSEQKPLIDPVQGSTEFFYQYPTWDDEEGNIFYKIVVVDLSSVNQDPIMYGYLEMIYPIFIVPPPGGPF